MSATLRKQAAFTIVELLIVIVVIAILAAISVVAYNGIQSRARASAASSALTQSAKKIALWQVDNPNTAPDCDKFKELTGATGANCTGAGVVNGDITYQYTPSTTVLGDYCITATTGSTSWTKTATSAPSSGGCAGHGQGGTIAVTNYVLNPGFEGSTFASGGNIGPSGGNTSIQTASPHTGSRFFRQNFTQASVGWGQFTETVPVGQYTASAWIRSNKAVSYTPYLQGSSSRTNSTNSGTITLAVNIWTQITFSFNITTAGTVQIGGYVSNNSTWTNSDYIDLDSVMMSSGTVTYAYADGTSPNWAWNGTANNATSTGPQL